MPPVVLYVHKHLYKLTFKQPKDFNVPGYLHSKLAPTRTNMYTYLSKSIKRAEQIPLSPLVSDVSDSS